MPNNSSRSKAENKSSQQWNVLAQTIIYHHTGVKNDTERRINRKKLLLKINAQNSFSIV